MSVGGPGWSPHTGPDPCAVCGGECLAFPDVDHLESYPFLPGGRDPLADKNYVIAPHRIVDTELERVVYGTGDRVPIADAIKYGLVPANAVEDTPPDEKPKRGRRTTSTRARKGPAEDRARKAGEDR